MTENRLDAVARSLARRAATPATAVVVAPADPVRLDEGPLQRFSRALAAPMPRRRALRLLGGGVVGTSLALSLRPRGAFADCTTTCQHKVTCDDYNVCEGLKTCGISHDRGCNCGDCLKACCLGSYQEGGQANCCTPEQGSNVDYRYCCPHSAPSCTKQHNPNSIESVCLCDQGQGQSCVDRCCPREQYCGGEGLGVPLAGFRPEGHCLTYCDRTRKTQQCPASGGACCVPPQFCDGSECVCPGSLSKVGDRCLKERPADPKVKEWEVPFWEGLLRSTSARSGSQHLRAGITAAGGADSALLALGAVEALGGAAVSAFTDGHRDRRYTRKVLPPKPKLPVVGAGAGLDGGSAAALNKLIVAEGSAYALMAAAATALARARALRTKPKTAHNRAARRAHLHTSAKYAGQAAKLLTTVPGLRDQAAAALQAGGAPEVTVTSDQVAALAAAIARSGLPADITALLRRLGATSDDLKRIRKGAAAGPTRSAGALIAPLEIDAGKERAQGLAAALSAYARSARKA
jgi:hypothetical protein